MRFPPETSRRPKRSLAERRHPQCTLRPAAPWVRPARLSPPRLPGAGLSMRARGIPVVGAAGAGLFLAASGEAGGFRQRKAAAVRPGRVGLAKVRAFVGGSLHSTLSISTPSACIARTSPLAIEMKRMMVSLLVPSSSNLSPSKAHPPRIAD